MSDDEDLYCNPQSNVFLQARMQKKPPKKATEKKSIFGKKPPPSPKKKAEAPRPAIPMSASDELGSLFKSGLTRPSELRKTAAPEKHEDKVEETTDNHIVDFKAHLRPVPSPIKTADENRRCSVTSETDIPFPPSPAKDSGNEVDGPQIKSPPIPKRTSTLTPRRPVPVPPATNTDLSSSVSERDPLHSVAADLPEILPDPPSSDDVVKDIVPSRPKRRLLQRPSKAPTIPLNTFPHSLNNKTNVLPDYIPSTYSEDDGEDMYTENDLPIPEDSEDMYTENDVPIPEVCDEMYAENELPDPEGDFDEMYAENELPTLPPLYDAPKTPLLPCLPEKPPVSTAHEQIVDEDEELYTDEVCDYPAFNQVRKPAVEEPSCPPVPQYNVDEEGEEDIYEEPEYPSQACPVSEYRVELEECEDIYDDIGNYNVGRVESPIPVRACPSPMASRPPAPPSALPPPPQLPASAPPPAAPATKQKQKGGLFGIFKKSKKKAELETESSVELTVAESSLEENPLSNNPAEEENEEMYIDGDGCAYSDDDDEPIYEDQ